MAEGNKQIRDKVDSIQPISLNTASIQIDMLHRFFPGKTFSKIYDDPETEELELSLGLSLNGRFGVDAQKSKSRKLTRSSSISNFFSGTDISIPSPPSAGIYRAVSLPAGTGEEWKKRKKLQSIRRMEAKRKRTEKQIIPSVTGKDQGGYDGNIILPGEVVNQEPPTQFFGEILKGSVSPILPKDGHGGVDNSQFVQFPPSSSPASAVSQASGSGSSSFVSDFDSQIVAGMSKTMEAKSPTMVHSVVPKKPPKGASAPAAAALKESSQKTANLGEDMPYVSTTGEGPNGKRIEGFLYRFRKGEEVRIVCVCHGNFLSPAEFVRHAGGGDVDHPLRHIVVNTTAASFL